MEACCFTGHRKIDGDELPMLKHRLERAIVGLIARGITCFHCGGAVGFDMLAGQTVAHLRGQYPEIKLIMCLPCRNQDERWTKENKRAYRQLLAAADEIIYVSELYYDGCMKKRNAFMVERSGHLIAYLTHMRSGTAQTVRLALVRGLTVHHLAANRI